MDTSPSQYIISRGAEVQEKPECGCEGRAPFGGAVLKTTTNHSLYELQKN